MAAIREGLADVKAGRTKPARAVSAGSPGSMESQRKVEVKYRVQLSARAERDVHWVWARLCRQGELPPQAVGMNDFWRLSALWRP